jgi:hypothetical protein
VKRFRYWRDSLCFGCCVLYALNRWVVVPQVHSRFLSGYFDDLLLIPCALPFFLQLQRWLGLRTHDDPPTTGEVASHLVIWSIVCEVVGPHLVRTIGDPLDVLAYSAGAVFAAWWWRRGGSPRVAQ